MIVKPVLAATAALTVVASLTGCKQDETLAGHGAGDKTWALVSIDGSEFASEATIRFDEDGKVTGKAPCNSYFSEQSAPYPWFKLSPIGATKMMCPDMDAETAFFSNLQAMELSEVSGDTLILSNEDGVEMIFKEQTDG